MENKQSNVFKKGDIIYRDLKHSGGVAYHYGVYIGDNTVIHFSTDGAHKESLEKFAGGYEVSKENIKNAHSPDDIVETAQSYYKNPEKWGSYNLATNNCEHFAKSCANGKKRSGQVQKVVGAGVVGLVVGGAAVGISIAKGTTKERESLYKEEFIIPSLEQAMKTLPAVCPSLKDTDQSCSIPNDNKMGSNSKNTPSFESETSFFDPKMSMESFQAVCPSVGEMDLSSYSIPTDNIMGSILENTPSFESETSSFDPKMSMESFQAVCPSVGEVDLSSFSISNDVSSFFGNLSSFKF